MDDTKTSLQHETDTGSKAQPEKASPRSAGAGKHFGVAELLIAALIGGIILTGYHYWTYEKIPPAKIYTTNARTVIDLAYYTALAEGTITVDQVKELVRKMKNQLEVVTQSGGVILNERFVIKGGEKIIFDIKGNRVEKDLKETANRIDHQLDILREKYPRISGIDGLN